jgi:uncharacterized membrane protein YraQ (UPF0718 family)/copper chaperone CopZ
LLTVLLDIVQAIWAVTADMAAWLLLGFLVAGFLSVFIDPAWLERHLGGRGLGPVFRASLFGVPLPLCSCGVIPVAASLRSHGASKPATTAFLLSTPQTGVDSIAITYTMLGPLFALFRPLMALVTGILGGGLVQAFGEGKEHSLQPALPRSEMPRGVGARLARALDYGLVTLPGDIGKALLLGVLIAGLLAALIPEGFLEPYLGRGALSVALMMVVGIPLYVCATASVPLAAGFIALGATPGAALAFLIAGPATNAATITTIGRVLGRRTTAIYLLTVGLSAWGGGMLLDLLMGWARTSLPALSSHVHQHHGEGWFDHLAAVVLVVVMTRSWWLQRRRSSCCASEEGDCSLSDASEIMELNISGMNCSHCSGSVERALAEMEGVHRVEVLLDEGRALVRGLNLDGDALVAAVDKLGFSASRR